MKVKAVKKYVLFFVALVLPVTLITSGLAAAQVIKTGTEEGKDIADTFSASYYSDQADVAGGLPPDDNPSVHAPNQPALTFSYYMVAGPEMHPRNTGNPQSYSSNGCIYMSSGTSTGLLTGSGLHIPDGSVIKYIRLYYHDSNASAGVDAFLTRYAPGSGTSDRVHTGSTNAFSGGYGFVVSTEITETVNNTAYAYHLYGWPDSAASSLQVCGIRVAYYAPPQSIFGVALPIVTK